MSIPGLQLPGLLSSTPVPSAPIAGAPLPTRTQPLAKGTEYRFEVSAASTLRIKLLSGTAELFGTELAPALPYTFSGAKAAVYTWHGCVLELAGEPESEYVGEETPMALYANAHFALERLRDEARAAGEVGPRALVVGPENAGKTSLVRVLTAYAVRAGRQPVVVNMDPRQGVLSVPGALTATAFASTLDVEEGWGSSPITGPSAVPVKMPLAYHLGSGNPEESGRVFRPLVTRLALAVTSRLEEDLGTKESGCIIDTPGAISGGKGGVYENIQHIVSEFSGACACRLSVLVLYVDGERGMIVCINSRYSERPPHPRLGAPLQRHIPPLRRPNRRGRRRSHQTHQIRRLRRPRRVVHAPAPAIADPLLFLRPRTEHSESVHADGRLRAVEHLQDRRE